MFYTDYIIEIVSKRGGSGIIGLIKLCKMTH